MATQTPNYSLVKPAVNDNYDVGVQNTNMDLIDTQLKANADAAADAVPKSLATEVSQFLLSTGAGAWAVKTVTEIKSLLGLGNAAYKDTGTVAGTVAVGNHTHTAAGVTDFAATVRATVITGLVTATNAVITATDTLLGALGKLQAQITAFKADYIRNPGYVADTGAVNAIVATLSPALAAYADGVQLRVKVAYTNTATAVTVNANALGVKTVYRANGNALATGDLLVNKIYEFTYNSTLGGFTVDGVEQAQITTNLTAFNSHKSRHATGGADLLLPSDIGASTRTSGTGTLAVASWVGSAAPYSYDFAIAGLLAADTPHVDRVTGTDAAAAALINTAWGLIAGYAVKPQTSAGKITFYASAKPTVAIPIMYEVVRT